MSVPKSTESQQAYRTPRAFFAWLHAAYHFTLDAAADASNALLPKFYDADIDGLAQTPTGEVIWINPPFKRIKAWITWAIERAEAGNRVVMLLPASLETEWFREYAARGDVACLYPRLPYINPDQAERAKKQGPPCASILVEFGPELKGVEIDRSVVPVRMLAIPDEVMDAVRAELKEAA